MAEDVAAANPSWWRGVDRKGFWEKLAFELHLGNRRCSLGTGADGEAEPRGPGQPQLRHVARRGLVEWVSGCDRWPSGLLWQLQAEGREGSSLAAPCIQWSGQPVQGLGRSPGGWRKACLLPSLPGLLTALRLSGRVFSPPLSCDSLLSSKGRGQQSGLVPFGLWSHTAWFKFQLCHLSLGHLPGK